MTSPFEWRAGSGSGPEASTSTPGPERATRLEGADDPPGGPLARRAPRGSGPGGPVAGGIGEPVRDLSVLERKRLDSRSLRRSDRVLRNPACTSAPIVAPRIR